MAVAPADCACLPKGVPVSCHGWFKFGSAEGMGMFGVGKRGRRCTSRSNHQRQAIQIGAATSRLNTSITEMSVPMDRKSTSRQRNSSGGLGNPNLYLVALKHHPDGGGRPDDGCHAPETDEPAPGFP